MDKPLVSVIVITYNASNTIIETLNSINSQTYSPLELIIADDCSQDDTAVKCNNWLEINQSRFTNSKLIVNDVNKGTAANLNIGIQASSGKWLKLLGDDLLLPDAIEKNIKYAIDNDCDFITSRIRPFIDDSRKELSTVPADNFKFPNSSKEQLISFLRNKLITPTPTWFFKREVFDRLGGFDEHYRLSEDIPFAFRMLESGGHFSYMQEVTVLYRITNTSVSNSKNLSGKQKQPYFENTLNVYYELIAPALKKHKLWGTLLRKSLLMHFYKKKIFARDNSLSRYFYGALCFILKF